MQITLNTFSILNHYEILAHAQRDVHPFQPYQHVQCLKIMSVYNICTCNYGTVKVREREVQNADTGLTGLYYLTYDQ